jgi:hypothetical protein
VFKNSLIHVASPTAFRMKTTNSLGKKKPPRLAVFGSVGFFVRRFCFYVNLPLLHRLRVGIAKVKVKVKSCKIHENLVIEWIDYNNINA